MRPSESIDFEIPDFSLIVLIGPAGSAKSTFAARWFTQAEVVSSNDRAGAVSDADGQQPVSADASDAVRDTVEERLKRRQLTVIVAANLTASERKQWIEIAHRWHAPPVAIVLDPDVKVCTARDSDWISPDFDAVALRTASEIRKCLRGLQREGFGQVWILPSAAAIDEARVSRRPLRTDKRGEHGPFDIIGDVHGCVAELESLLERLGYKVSWQGGAGERQVCVVSPQGRKLVLVGDLVDRGPRSPDVLRIAMAAVGSGAGLVIQGNHDNKLRRWLDGRNVKIGPGLRECINQLSHETDAFKAKSKAFLCDLPSHYWLDAGRLTVAHAGLKEEMIGRCSPAERAFALYGQTSGEIDEFGLPVRADWAAGYRGKATVVYGHTPVLEAEWVNNTICIDTGCVFGGKLTALRWPEKQLVSVPAARTYFQPVRPLTLRAPPRA